MLLFFENNLATVLISLALTAVVLLIVLSMRKNKKKGQSACGFGCTNCPMSGECRSTKQ